MGYLEVKLGIFRTFLEKFRKDFRPYFGIFVARPNLKSGSHLGTFLCRSNQHCRNLRKPISERVQIFEKRKHRVKKLRLFHRKKGKTMCCFIIKHFAHFRTRENNRRHSLSARAFYSPLRCAQMYVCYVL